MIAKGHDFPRVTLVGVLSADQALGLPDFRAGERCFQLLTQVAGRAGRGERPGRVVVQAFDPDHPILRLAARQDYEAFFDREIVYRRALRYPPVVALVRSWSRIASRPRAALGRTTSPGAEAPARPLDHRRSGPGTDRATARTLPPADPRPQRGAVAFAACRRTSARGVQAEVPRKALVVDVDPQSLH